MRKRWTWWAVAAVVFSAAFIVGGYWAVKTYKLDGNLITALFTALAAVGAGVSAFAAFLSAQQSSATARDALRALSLAGRPALEVLLVRVEGKFGVMIGHRLVEPKMDRAVMRWNLRDGRQGQSDFSAAFESAGHAKVVAIPGDFPTIKGSDVITVDFWGKTGPVGWRLRQVYNYKPFEKSATDVLKYPAEERTDEIP
ncbi:hypothetical protein [Leifsonia shinshuensis]|uniref:hypothetical protein n=1 Tax=Leifsonia shinshuensis TaxID=150026 RepID=UPI002857EA3E|nr:hypothetical protein [Leifsonia shinshuensis]MDR6970843.1 hypothetical protein [Leifsonia shinshuensis]